MNTLPAIPSPTELDVATIGVLGREVLAWAETVDDIAAVKDATARWSAITEYVRRTSREGVAEAEGALRRLEVRVGKMLGPPPTPQESGRRKGSVATEPSGLMPDARHDFRQLAEHVDVVEAVIASSSDESPPSRRKCLTEIERRKRQAEDEDFRQRVRSIDPEKVREALQWAKENPPHWEPSDAPITADRMAFVLMTWDRGGLGTTDTDVYGPFVDEMDANDFVATYTDPAEWAIVTAQTATHPSDAWWFELDEENE